MSFGYAWRDRRLVHWGVLGILGIMAAVISGSIVLERVSHTQGARVHAAQSSNLPRREAERSLAEAKQALAKAEAAASAECSSGRGRRCNALEKREVEARQRVEAERSKLVGLGAEVPADPTVAMLGEWAGTFRLLTLLGLPLWLELAAPALLAYGFAPMANRREGRKPAAQPAAKRRRKAKREARTAEQPRRPATRRTANARVRQLRLVAANDA